MTSAKDALLSAGGWRTGPRLWLGLATVVLLLAAAFRTVALDEVPPGLAQDEVLDADIALFIRRGEHALFFSHGYGHEPLYHYWAAPYQALLGDNILSIRLPAGFLGLLLVALTLRWARRDYGATAALVAGFGLAVSWWPIIFSRIGIRPILEPVLLVLAVWFWPLRARVFTRRGLLSAGLAGLWLGLSTYSYTAARVTLLIPLLLLVVLLGLAIIARRTAAGRSSDLPTIRAQVIYATAALSVGLLVYLPLAITLRANPELQQRIEQLEGPLTSLREGDAGSVLRMTAATLGVFGVTGDPRWTYGIPNRPLFDPVTAALFLAGLAVALWHWKKPVYALLSAWLAVALLPSALSPDAPSTVRLIGALPVVYLLPGLAVSAAERRLRAGRLSTLSMRPQGLALFIAVPVLIFSFNAYRTIRDGFIRWPREMETRLLYQTTLRDIGRHWSAAGLAAPPIIAEGFYEPIDGDGLRRSIGVDPAARWVQAGEDVAGALIWPGGEGSVVYVPEYAPLDPELAAAGGILDEPLFRYDGSPSFAVYDLPAKPAVELRPIDIGFGDPAGEALAALAGMTLPENEASGIHLLTWWRVQGELPEDVAIFIHLVDGAGEIVAQYDGLDAIATTLRPGDDFLQRHVLPLPKVIRPGDYLIRLGLYRRGDGRQIPTLEGADYAEIFRCNQAGVEPSGLKCGLTESD